MGSGAATLIVLAISLLRSTRLALLSWLLLALGAFLAIATGLTWYAEHRETGLTRRSPSCFCLIKRRRSSSQRGRLRRTRSQQVRALGQSLMDELSVESSPDSVRALLPRLTEWNDSVTVVLNRSHERYGTKFNGQMVSFSDLVPRDSAGIAELLSQKLDLLQAYEAGWPASGYSTRQRAESRL